MFSNNLATEKVTLKNKFPWRDGEILEIKTFFFFFKLDTFLSFCMAKEVYSFCALVSPVLLRVV